MADHPLHPVAALPGVAEAVDQARTAVDRLFVHKALRRARPRVSAEAALRSARASAALAGADWPLEEVRRRTDHGPVLTGALRASAELGQLVTAWQRAPLQVLARLHVLAATGIAEPADLGRPRQPGQPVSDGPTGARPPEPVETAVRLDQLAGLLTGTGQVPAVVLAAVVHGELLTLRPFTCGNGVVARAAQRLTLIAGGLDPNAVTVPEAGHWEFGIQGYEAALAGYAQGDPDGVGGWVLHCAEAVRLGAQESLAVCEAMARG